MTDDHTLFNDQTLFTVRGCLLMKNKMAAEVHSKKTTMQVEDTEASHNAVKLLAT